MFIEIKSKNSLIHIGSLDSFDITEGGKEAARNILDYFECENENNLRRAIEIYDKLIPNENFGGEYTALRWICKAILNPYEDSEDFLSHSEVKSWYEYLWKNSFEKLKFYINYKYHFKNIEPSDVESKRMLRFLEDFILFSNPDRNRWENAKEGILRIGIKKQDIVADVGAGSGYFSFKFADIVGDFGKIYSIETNPLHIDYLRRYIEDHDMKNIEVIECDTEGIGLASYVKVDVIFMCSLYHVLYAALTEEERDKYILSIKDALKSGGKLVIVDNNLVEDGDLPYHGPYISKDLIIGQLFYYGFKLIESFDFTIQRYVLIFQYVGEEIFDVKFEKINSENALKINSTSSLVNYRIADSAPTAGFTQKGREASKEFLKALYSKKESDIKIAYDLYEKLIPSERIGDEYTAFQWFCKLLLLGEEGVILDEISKDFYELFKENDFDLLKRYIKTKYELLEEDEKYLENITQISEYITFNNPNRNTWEKTEEMLSYINIKKGEDVADIGCGSGYFTYKFVKSSGDGKVFATEINKDALYYVEQMKEKYKLNIFPIISSLDSVNLPKSSVDTIFMCSMYHAVYIASIEYVKDRFIESIKRSLRDNGRLIIVDNDIKRANVPAYFGSTIDKNLIIHQLKYYGFELFDYKQFIPQRYILVFKKR